MNERLDKILASQNLGSRKEAGALIRRGAVAVNGQTVRKPETKADPERDEIAVEGRVLTYRRHVYIMMNKPAGVLSAANDPRATTVIDLVPESLRRRGLFPAGRLDKDTTGLLIITDDGDYAHGCWRPHPMYISCMRLAWIRRLHRTMPNGLPKAWIWEILQACPPN